MPNPSKTRIYLVNDISTTPPTPHLVEASNGAQALQVITARQFEVSVPPTKVVVDLMATGVLIQFPARKPALAAVPQPALPLQAA